MRILVTGGTGLVGSNVIKLALERGDDVVAALYRRRPAAPWECATVPMDLEDEGSVRSAVSAVRPGAVIHCAAPRDEDRLEQDHAWGWRVMVDSTRWLAEACREAGARLVFVSSDWVFGRGGEPPYAEDAPPCPANYFGFLKAVGETLAASLCPDSAVARTAGVYGVNWADPAHSPREEPPGMGWLANYYARRLAQGQPVAAWFDYVNVTGNPTLASELAEVLLELAARGERGLFHCCGRDSVTRLELAQAVAEAFGFDPALVRAARPEEMDRQLLAGRLPAPRDSRLECRSSQNTLGRVYLGLAEGLAELRRQLAEAGALPIRR